MKAIYRCVALVFVLGPGFGASIVRAQPPGNDVAGTQVLTRGPVHEAFAGMVTYNPEPGVVVTKAPPDVIEEMPPDVRPEGDNVSWIPGYWAWDDERNDYLWVSGTWRALPPGRAWIAGYWGQVPQGYQWTSGYWADAAARDTTYLPPPPATVENGPNIDAPSVDYGWTPGCWLWYQGRYAWSPGYWAQGREDWDWMPAHYLWTPRGYIFVGGFWDYSIARRGVLFAPVYFEPGVYSRHGYLYAPTVVINVGVFDDFLFLRPRYNHYYFGDYYAASYNAGGFYASFSFQSGRYGYDPIFSHERWEHRQDRGWEHTVQATYQDRRDHESARPPRTWAQSNAKSGGDRPNREVMATPIDQLARNKGSAMKFQTVPKVEQQTLAQRGREVQQGRDQRRTLEAKGMDTSTRKPGAVFEPAKVQLPKSSIVAKPASQLGKAQAPPKLQQSSKPDPKFQPKPESSGRSQNVDKGMPQTEPRKLGSEINQPPRQDDATPREKQIQPDTQPRAKEPATKFQEQPQQNNVKGTGQPALQPSEPTTRPRRDPNQKGGAQLLNRDRQRTVIQRPPAPADSQAQPPAGGNPAENERAQANPADKSRENKGRE